MPLRRAGKGSGRGAHATDPFTSWGKTQPVAGTAEPIARALASQAWRRLSAGDGTKGPRLDDGASVELADLEAEEDSPEPTGLWTRGLLIGRTITDQDLAFFSPWCPAGTLMETLVRVEGHRWAIEDAFETAQTERGLPHNETRSWHGWHRHGSLVMLAFAMMAVVRPHAHRLTSPQKEPTRAGCSAGLLVCPGHPPGRHTPRPAPDRACLRDRLVRVATSASGGGASLTSQAKAATVVLSVRLAARSRGLGCSNTEIPVRWIWRAQRVI